jgi:hypothetical protein
MSLWVVIAHRKVKRSIAIKISPLDALGDAVLQHFERNHLGEMISSVVIHVIVFIQRAHDV